MSVQHAMCACHVCIHVSRYIGASVYEYICPVFVHNCLACSQSFYRKIVR